MTLEAVQFFAALAGVLAYLALTVFVIVAWARRLTSRWMLLACVATLLFLTARLLTGLSGIALGMETVATLAWVALLAHTLGVGRHPFGDPRTRTVAKVTMAAVVFGVCSLAGLALLISSPAANQSPLLGITPILDLLLAIGCLVLLEQVVRNTRQEERWRTRYLSIGLGTLFAFQVLYNAGSVLFQTHLPELLAIQPAIVALTAPFIAVAVRRTAESPLPLNISREFVFRTGVLLATGAFLLAISALGYLVQLFGGAWHFALLTLLMAVVVMGLAVVLGSTRVRARGRQFLAEHLFRHKYDYRSQWQTVTGQLTEPSLDYDLQQQVIRALGTVTESEGGAVWSLTDDGLLVPVSRLRTTWRDPISRQSTQALTRWFENAEDAVDLTAPPRGFPAPLRQRLRELPDLRFVVPLLTDTRLTGVVGLREPLVPVRLSWEDLDLLRLIARQSAGFVALQSAERALADAGKLNSFNQISAFIVHDAKTISAQLSLLLRNAQKHKSNPVFIDDMLKTVDNSVQRINKLLEQLRAHQTEQPDTLNLATLVPQVLALYTAADPPPAFTTNGTDLTVSASATQLGSAIGHLVQNAIEAAAAHARGDRAAEVRVWLAHNERWAEVHVQDNGAGMDTAFIQQKLFQPFTSTKGVSGMGIGAYQARTYIRALGGDISVTSEPGQGAHFVIRLPLQTLEPT